MLTYFFKFISACIIAVLFCFSASAQGSTWGYLYVYPNDLNAIPNDQGVPANSGLYQIMETHQVISYTKSFPGALSEELNNAYEMHLNGDLNELKAQLEATGLFALVEKASYMKLASTPFTECLPICNSPQPVNDPNSGYELTLPGYTCAWNITQGDPSIIVAVVDTDFDLNHPELQGKIISKVGTPGDPTCSSHGNLVAGTIVANANNGVGVAGVAPNVKVAGYVVAAMGSCVDGCVGHPWGQVWQAYLDGHRIINVSYGDAESNITIPQTTKQAVKEMTETGTILILAAGNKYGLNSHTNISDIPGVINVSSVSSDGTIHATEDANGLDTNVPAVTYNPFVDLCAPGDGVNTVEFEYCGTTYNNSWGTSLAAPNVAGAAALIISVNPCLKSSEVENILKTTTCPIVNNPIPGETGTGYLNAYAAVEKAKGISGFILNDMTLTGENYASDEIIVDNGATLTIHGTLKISEGKSITVRPGSEVILLGKLTNSCNQPWKGVGVIGSSSSSQYSTGHHGKLTCRPGSVIENSESGVSLWNGGMIFAHKANFINNGVNISFSPYYNFWPFQGPSYYQPRDYISGIQDCNFIWNNDYKHAAEIDAGIVMHGVNGVSILGCKFTNERNIKNPTGFNNYGYGIKATDAFFRVYSSAVGNTYPPTSYNHTMFKGLGYGVYVGTAQVVEDATPNITADDFVNVPYVVQQAVFSECIVGIHNRFASQGVIVGNTFEMGKLPVDQADPGTPVPFTNTQVGIFMEDGANGFEIQENTFFKPAGGNVANTYGTYCKDLGYFNNKVRKNTYSGVTAGNLAEGNNAFNLVNQSSGLHYLCNTNSTTNNDFFVYPNGKIKKDQGEYRLDLSKYISAGNTFTRQVNPHGDFKNVPPTVVYRFYDGNNMEMPKYYSSLFLSSSLTSNSCASTYCLPPCRTREELITVRSDFDKTQLQFEANLADIQTAIISGDDKLVEQKAETASGLRSHLDEFANLMALHMTLDTTDYNPDSVLMWWRRMDTPISGLVMARNYLKIGHTDMAYSTLDAIASKYELSDSDLIDIYNYRIIMQIIEDEADENLPNEKKAILLDIAQNSSGNGSAWAKNILTLSGYHFPPEIKPISDNQERKTDEKPKAIIERTPFVVAPNPAVDFVQFSTAKTFSDNIWIKVSDTNGRTVWESSSLGVSKFVWRTNNTSSGIYFYAIGDSSKILQKGKIFITK